VPIMDSQPAAENDDSFLSVILEGAHRALLGDPLFTASPFVASPLDSRATRENDGKIMRNEE